MADEHADHHGPEDADTSELWQDDSHGVIAEDVAKMWFWVTVVGAIAYIAVVIFWIFL